MRPVFAVLLSLVVAGPALTGGDKAWKPIQVTWHGQSFFEIKTSKGTNIIMDPHLIPAYGRVQGVKGDIVLMSHNHNDHTQVGALENAKDKDLKIIPGLKGPGLRADWNLIKEQVKDVKIRSLGLYHDTEQGLKYGRNTAFILEVDGWRIVNLGDLGHLLTPEQVKKIGPVDVLFLPIGGVYTLNGGEAKKVVDQLKPKEYIFPQHYGTKVYDELLGPEEFLEAFPRANVTSSLDNTVTLNRDPQRPRPLVVQLHYWPRGGKKDAK
jgi:L-ascorbate metabolism protein UlaG (beta-lactamase superfamily)